MIGRRQEHAAIIGHLVQADARVILLSGEAGIGKSCLVRNLIEDLAGRGYQVVQGSCFEADSAHPFAPLRDLLRALLAEHAPADLAAMAGPYAPVLGRLVPELAADGLQISAPPDKRDLHDALERVLAGIARQAPLVVILEDLHWSDLASLEFLLFLARRSPGKALTLLCTYRNDEVSPDLRHVLAALDRERLAFDVLLRGLSPVEIDLMLRAIFRQSRSAPAELLHLLATLTDGNPFFIEEVLSALGMAGAERTPEGFVRVHEADRLPIPRSVQDAVHRRTAQLSPAARGVLALAAVVGRRFSFDLLADLADLDESELVATLTELVGAQLIFEESAEHFSFRHALTRQAVYAGLLTRTRQRLHQRVGEMLERTHGDDETRRADLAYHFFAAANCEKALDYAWQSGTHAMTLHAPTAAVTHFSSALHAASLLDRQPDPALLCARGAAYEQVGEFDHALADYESAQALANASGRPALEVEALLSLGLLWAARDYARAGSVVERALEVARTLGSDPIVARCLNRLGNWHLNSEHPADALRCHMEALAIAEAVGTSRDIAETLDLLGLTTYFLGDLERGEHYLRRAVELWRSLDDRRGLASSLILLTMSAPTYHTDTVASFATHQAVQASVEEAVAITREIGWKAGESWGLWIMNGMNLGAQGAYARAIPGIRQAIALAEEIEHVQWITAASCMLGNVYADLLAHEQAVEQFTLALELAQATRSSYWIRSAAAWLISAAVRQGDMTLATAVLGDMLGTHPSTDSPAQRLIWRSSAEHALATGEPDRALDVLDRLVATAPPQSTPRPIARLEYLRGQAFVSLGDAQAAESAFRAACDTAHHMGTRPLVWRSHLSLGLLYRTERQEDLARHSFTLARSIIEDLAGTVPEEPLRDGFLAATAQLFPRDVWRPGRSATRLAPGGLTRREQEVARLVAEGQSNRAISDALFITEWTAATHVRNILAKLGMRSRTQIAAWAVEHDLLHAEPT